jgi:hypothetical protein
MTVTKSRKIAISVNTNNTPIFGGETELDLPVLTKLPTQLLFLNRTPIAIQNGALSVAEVQNASGIRDTIAKQPK